MLCNFRSVARKERLIHKICSIVRMNESPDESPIQFLPLSLREEFGNSWFYFLIKKDRNVGCKFVQNYRKNMVQTWYTQRNLIISNWNQIVFTIFRLIWNQTNVRLTPNQSENCNYNLNSVWFIKISKRFLHMNTDQTYICGRDLASLEAL